MKYTVFIQKGPTSYGACIPDLPGCIAAGYTREEVFDLITATVADPVELTAGGGETIPEPSSAAIQVEVPVPGIVGEMAHETGS